MLARQRRISAAWVAGADALRWGAVQDTELMAVMTAADVDKNGCIDYEEFICATINLSKLEREYGCQEAFAHFDTDGDGTITRDEIRQGLISSGGCACMCVCAWTVAHLPAYHYDMVGFEALQIVARTSCAG